MIRRKTYPPDDTRYPLTGKSVVPCKRCGQPIAWHFHKKGTSRGIVKYWVPLDVRAAREVPICGETFTSRHTCWDGTGRLDMALSNEIAP